jgi:hypothetical protein
MAPTVLERICRRADDWLARAAGSTNGQDEVIAMLRRAEGATVAEVASATGWQRHTVRGVFSGVVSVFGKRAESNDAPPLSNSPARVCRRRLSD